MKNVIALAIALGFSLGSCATNASEARPTHHRHHKHHHGAKAAEHEVPQAAPFPVEPANPSLKPYGRPGERDTDGLSRNPNDCNEGCIGGNPR